MIEMNHRGIRNPGRYYAARTKEAARRQRLVDAAFWNIITIVNEHGGELTARNKVEALDILIRNGVFGASSKFPVRVSRHRKEEHRKNIMQTAPTEIPDGYRKWYAIVTQALELLESADTITLTTSRAVCVIRTTNQPEPPPLQAELERLFGQVITTPDPRDLDEHYNPFTRCDARMLRSLDEHERSAYK